MAAKSSFAAESVFTSTCPAALRQVLYSGYLEKRLGITTTTRKLSVVTRLCELAE